MTISSEATIDGPAQAYRRPWRVLAGALTVLGGVSLPAILLVVVLATDPPVTPPDLAIMFASLTVIPLLLAALTRHAFAAVVEVRGRELVVRRRDIQVEVPCTSIAHVRPWALPIPGPGVSFELSSGRRLQYGIELRDPVPLLDALSIAGVTTARAALTHPAVVWAHARACLAPWRWYHHLVKFGLFGFLPAVALFNAHQHIAYGGTLGQYYIYGLVPYLKTLAIYWGTIVIYLVLYAGVWRGVAEGVALAVAPVAPSRVATVRRGVETWCRVVYYGGVPLLLLVRFLP